MVKDCLSKIWLPMVKKFIVPATLICSGCFLLEGTVYPFTFIKEKNSSEKLQLNGCYFLYDHDSVDVSIYVFYKQGISFHPGAYSAPRFDTIRRDGVMRLDQKKMAEVEWAWGLYKIKGDSIYMERRFPRGGDYVPWIHHGTVLNDTTFRFTLIRRSDNADSMVVNDTFHFPPLKVKPDSTNNLIPLD
jgi:hypothetical protein